MDNEHRVCNYEERRYALFDHCDEGGVELVGTSGLQELKLHSHRPRHDLQVRYRDRLGRIGRVRKDRHTVGLGDGLLEQLQPLAECCHADAEGQPRDVPTRARKAYDQPERNRIAAAYHDDRNRPGGVLGCDGWRRRRCYDDVHLEPDQLGRELGQPVGPALRESIVDDDVLPLSPPVRAQPFPERLDE